MNQHVPVAGCQPASGDETGLEIAIVGMAGRFPGADTLDAFWRNIEAGRESVRPLTDLELAECGRDAAAGLHENFVPAAARLEGMDRFDADFFDITAREARLMDPQQRLFLECAWEALEDAGYAGRLVETPTGVVAGAGPNMYFANNVVTDHDFRAEGLLDSMGGFQAMLGNDKDYLPTRAAFKLGLHGPALNVQTACSTSLVALHLACRMLQTGECDLALTGAASLVVPDGGYFHQDAMILSPDGHCRPFAADANGTVFGSGVGVLALRRLDDAWRSGDRILAVIKGSAINNDGAQKASFSAPSVRGQAAVIRKALAEAAVPLESIGLIEAHGTGTKLGDPIEIEALRQAFAGRDGAAPPIAIGSLKANVGHLIAAAGVAGVIKSVLAMRHRTLPPAINVSRVNPEIDFTTTPFSLDPRARPWDGHLPRRACVSSFGIGGTNAHVVLEEAPGAPTARLDAGAAPRRHTMTLSARSPAALDAMIEATSRVGSPAPRWRPRTTGSTTSAGRSCSMPASRRRSSWAATSSSRSARIPCSRGWAGPRSRRRSRLPLGSPAPGGIRRGERGDEQDRRGARGRGPSRARGRVGSLERSRHGRRPR